MSRPAVLVGSTGQLAHDLLIAWDRRFGDRRLVALTHADIEVADLDSVRGALASLEPDLVINTSAYHRVDVVEETPAEGFAVNATGARNLALACRDLDARLCHLSTDYVFSGRLGRPLVETDPVDPINVYGVTKAAGEMLIRHTWHKHFIVRSSGLYGVAGSSGKGGNFVETMLRLGAAGKPLRVVDDQVLTPTSTTALAGQILDLLETDEYGTFHATCQGGCSWHDFAAEIFRQAGLTPELGRQSTEESGAGAVRPAFSVLDNAALRALGRDRLPPWEEALAGYLKERTG